MAKDDWITIGEYSNSASARVAAGLLASNGVANRVWPNPQPTVGADSPGDFYIWVAPEVAEEARRILAEPVVSEDELTRQALNEPPPDDA
jgi:hypothetical protein